MGDVSVELICIEIIPSTIWSAGDDSYASKINIGTLFMNIIMAIHLKWYINL